MSDYAVYFTLKSRNAKVGPLPVSTITNTTCPDACPLKKSGCYAKGGPLGILWARLSRTVAGSWWRGPKNPTNPIGAKMRSLTWAQYCARVAALPLGQFWRHAQAGDLPGKGDRIDAKALGKLVQANRGRNGWTYTHKPVNGPYGLPNANAIKAANAAGFTINLSADNLTEADQLAELKIGPVVTILPESVHGNVTIHTPAGRRVVVCPATYRDDTTCATCKLCARQRDVVVGFPAHGASRRAASAIASA